MRHALIFEAEILPFELEEIICVYLLRKVSSLPSYFQKYSHNFIQMKQLLKGISMLKILNFIKPISFKNRKKNWTMLKTIMILLRNPKNISNNSSRRLLRNKILCWLRKQRKKITKYGHSALRTSCNKK